jgi:hypothetical protein
LSKRHYLPSVIGFLAHGMQTGAFMLKKYALLLVFLMACGSSDSEPVQGASQDGASFEGNPNGDLANGKGVLIRGNLRFENGKRPHTDSVALRFILKNSDKCYLASAWREGVVKESGRFQARFDSHSLREHGPAGAPASTLDGDLDWNCNRGDDDLFNGPGWDNVEIKASVPINQVSCEAFCSDADGLSECVTNCLRFSEIRGTASAPWSEGRSVRASLVLDSLAPRVRDELEGPDLSIDFWATARSLELQEREFSESSCALQEGCLNGSGLRKLLRFDTAIQNIGNRDLILGNPQGNDLFEFDSCHNHYHLMDLTAYELFEVTEEGVAQTITEGRKQGFCMLDRNPIGDVQGEPTYTCTYQGISSGWVDVYERNLDCQWIDVTDVEPGFYFLRITVNPLRQIEELDFSNNTIEVPVRISHSRTRGPLR